ncbi:MAG: substrate-binding domain-containing protein [Spirochaetes bacterium]|nr:substrate-binding domain-containing protein [Spirochaetota bacterium]
MKAKPLLKENITVILRKQLLTLREDKLIRISPERVLAQELNVSRLSLRAALKVLIDEGLLIQKQGSGTYITPIADINSIQLIIAPDIKTNDPFFTAFLAELSSWLSRESVQLSIFDHDRITGASSHIPLIIVGLLNARTITKIKSTFKHIVAVQCYPDDEDISQIYFDDYKIGYLAAKKFLEYNHKRILQVSGPAKYPSSYYRRKGFLDALAGTGANVSEIPGKMNWSCGYKAGESIIKDFNGRERPTAIFTANDWMAIGLIQKLTEARIKIPQEISIIGCDDIPLAKEVVPGLTTFRFDFKCLIGELISVLNEKYINKNNISKKILLPAPYIKRESLIKI